MNIAAVEKPAFLFISLTLLLNANDIELNPGPAPSPTQKESTSLYLCGACKEPVTWDDMGVMCETCETWYHVFCQGIGESTYERLGNTSIAWTCLSCNSPNYSSVLFDLHGLETSNKFGSLNESSVSSIDTIDSADIRMPAHPLCSSSPVKPRPKPAVARRPLRILNVNCQSLVHKKPSFYNLVDSSKPDILIATETWFDGQIHDAEYFNLDHFTVHRKDRCCGKGGGVIVAVNKEYVSTREEDLESTSTEMIWVKVVIKGSKSLHIGGCYRAKIGDEDTLDALDKALQRICGSSNNSVLLAGDFNLPGWDWKSNTLKANCAYPNLHYKFIDIIDDNNLTQIVDVPTRLDNTLDLIATNRPNQINRTHTLPGIGDHDIVYTELNIQPARRSQTPRVVQLYHKANWSGFCERISEVADNISQTEDTLSVEELWNLLKMKILEGIQSFIPHKTLKSKSSCP